ncbi:MAG: hypothetical protein BGO67_02885 [Alphaproteobacteria bacterium 41-28]|nr:MAG: hypothetical protein BGO67_02885 [Alphaproteobacteria bacterium 41-28]
MKYFSYLLIATLNLSLSPLQAGLDDDFEGNILVIGGYKNKPGRLSINIDDSGDIKGSGWNHKLIQELTPKKYETAVFEHVGKGLIEYDVVLGKANEDTATRELAEAYYKVLKPGGKIELLSFAVFYNGSDDTAWSLRAMHENDLKFTYDSKRKMLNLVYNSENKYKIPEHTYMKMFKEHANNFNNDMSINGSVFLLDYAGFQDITVQFEKPNIIPGTLFLGSLHISATKPARPDNGNATSKSSGEKESEIHTVN